MNPSMFNVTPITFPDTIKNQDFAEMRGKRWSLRTWIRVLKTDIAQFCVKYSLTVVTSVYFAPQLLWRSAFIVLGYNGCDYVGSKYLNDYFNFIYEITFPSIVSTTNKVSPISNSLSRFGLKLSHFRFKYFDLCDCTIIISERFTCVVLHFFLMIVWPLTFTILLALFIKRGSVYHLICSTYQKRILWSPTILDHIDLTFFGSLKMGYTILITPLLPLDTRKDLCEK